MKRILQYSFLYICVMIFTSSCTRSLAPAESIRDAHLSSDKSTYTVQSGDTLHAIAWHYQKDYQVLAKQNGLRPPYLIRPGQKIWLDKTKKNTKKIAEKRTTTKRANTAKSPSSDIKRVASSTRKKNKKHFKNNAFSKNTKKVSHKNLAKWKWPAKGKVIGRFSNKKNGNKGIDIAAKKGDPVRAAQNGTVVYRGAGLRGYGQLIIIKHNNDYLSAYAHNDNIFVKEDEVVQVGQHIADIGSTGQQPALHFEIRFRGKPVDPMKYLPKRP